VCLLTLNNLAMTACSLVWNPFVNFYFEWWSSSVANTQMNGMVSPMHICNMMYMHEITVIGSEIL